MTESPAGGEVSPAHASGRQWAVLAVLCLSLLVVSLDNTILNVALPTLVRKLHATDSQLQWIVDGYTIVFAGLMITFGSLGDRFGRRGALIIGLVVFATGSPLSAFSASADELIGFRCVMGAGGALVMPSTLSLLTNVFTEPKERARAIGMWSGTSGLGIALGPIIGGWLLAHFWWGSVFLVNVPIVAAGLVAVAVLVPTSKDPATRRPDHVGTVLSIAGLGLLLWGIIEAPIDGWTSRLVVVGLVAGLVLLAAFVKWEMRCEHPMFRMHFFSDARFSAASVSVSLVFFALFGAMFLLTQYLQSVLGYSPLEAGLRLAPVAVTLAVGAPIATFVVERVGTKIVVVAGLALVAVGLGLLSQLSVHSGYLAVLIAILVSGFGMGLTLAPSIEAIMGSLPVEEAGVGSAMNGTNIQVGGAVGVAVLGSMLNQHYRGHLAPTLAQLHLPGPVAHAARSSLGGALAVASHLHGAAMATLVSSAKTAFVGGVNAADLLGAGVAVVGVLVALAFLPARAGRPGPRMPSGGAGGTDGRTAALIGAAQPEGSVEAQKGQAPQ
jgi:EmrB/QacA subfamily drug resistance transporter